MQKSVCSFDFYIMDTFSQTNFIPWVLAQCAGSWVCFLLQSSCCTSPSLMEAVDWEVDSLAFSDQTEPESPDVDPEPLEATSRFF